MIFVTTRLVFINKIVKKQNVLIVVLFLSLKPMKLQNIISICLLAVYTIVLSHNFVPHHHHSQAVEVVEHCNHEDHHRHDAIEGQKQVRHSHDSEAHIHCSFEDVIILNKKISLSEVFLLTTFNEVIFATEDKQLFADTYIIPQIPESHCRDVQLRGPPQFS